jgi:cation diffusion facilitator CzcD-associated flavoprotein CzcO
MCEALAAETDTLVSLGMRDVDRDFKSIVVVRKDSGICSFEDLDNRHIVTGASDSPQSHIVPLHYLFANSASVKPASVTAMDMDLGKHGDTACGEVEALRSLSTCKTNDVALVSQMIWDRARGGLLSLDTTLVLDTCMELDSVQIPPFDHCQFDALLSSENEDDLSRFGEAILGMDMQDPIQGPLMKLEGIANRWVGPRQSGYDIVRTAMGVSSKHRPASNFQYRNVREYSVRTAPREKRIAVIGAGVAGLQAVRALQGRGFPVTAFEASSSVGGVWAKNYANFGLQVPKQLYEFQDFPMRSVKWGEYPTGPQVQGYIEDYASAFGLYDAIQFQSRVVSATHLPDDGSKWRLVIEKDGNESTQDFDFLVAAGGLFSGLNKLIPAISGLSERFQGTLVHSCDFDDASISRNKRVVVIGGGKSAVDCAVEAARAGATSVTVVQREAHWPTPRRIAGLIPFQYIFLSRLGTALVSAHQGTFPGGSGPLVNAFRDSVGPYLVKPVFRAVEELFALQFGLRGDLRPKADIVADFYDVALVLDSDFKELRKSNGSIEVMLGEIQEVKTDGKTLLLSDGSSIESNLIVAATGYENSFDFFDNRTLDNLDVQSDGVYLHRYILPEKVPNLAFIGYVAAISNISTYGLQAEWLARYLTGDLLSGATPNREAIEERKAWARSWMPHSSKRGMLVLLHQTHYHDQLLRDMGENPRRKSMLAEYIMPYEPADYNGIMGGSPRHR